MSTAIPRNAASFTTATVARATHGTILRGGDGEARVHHGATTDSRAVDEGSVFVALRGERFDGHAFVDDAVKKGASLVVVERGRDVSGDADVVAVDDTLVAWGDLAHAHLSAWKSTGGRVVAITGSAGKTTTKEVCARLLARVGAVHATAGNLNNRIGVPAVVLGLEARHAFAVIEMGMSERGEIARLTEIAPPDAAVVTNVGLAHAGGVGGNEDDVAREKGAIFAAIREGGTAVVNVDDARVVAESKRTAGRVVTFGRAASADYRIADRESLGAQGSRVTIARGMESVVVDLPVVGEAGAIDFIAALAAADAVAQKKLAPSDMAAAAASLDVPPGRASLHSLADGTLVIDDSYNANPDSMRSAIRALGEIALREGRRAVAVLGEMRELGPRAEAEHAAIGDELARSKVSFVIGCGGLADVVLDRAAASGIDVRRAEDARNAAKIAVSEITSKDVVLVKASRGVAAEIVVEALIEARGEARS